MLNGRDFVFFNGDEKHTMSRKELLSPTYNDGLKGQQLSAQGNRPGYKAEYRSRPERAKALNINAFALLGR